MTPLPQSRQRLKEGDRVKYTGKRFHHLYQNLVLTIHSVDCGWGIADCRKPDGEFTTGIPFGDLKRIDSGDTQLSG